MVLQLDNTALVLRSLQVLFAFLVLALASAAINNCWYLDSDGFLLFTSLFSMFSVAYIVLVPVFAVAFYHIFVVLGLEMINALFWFCGWIAEAATAGKRIFYTFALLQGCQAGKAAAAFGAFSWIVWMITLVLLIRSLLKEGRFPGITQNPAAPNETPLEVVNNTGSTNPAVQPAEPTVPPATLPQP